MASGSTFGTLTLPSCRNFYIGVSLSHPTALHRAPLIYIWVYIVYICEILYVLNMGLIKTSILFFYLHVFPKRLFRIQTWIVMGFCAITTITFTLVTVFQCRPISYVWDKDLKGGQCINYNTVAWVNAGINILQDILIVVLPVNELRSLQMGKKKKVGLFVMFGLGVLYVYRCPFLSMTILLSRLTNSLQCMHNLDYPSAQSQNLWSNCRPNVGQHPHNFLVHARDHSRHAMRLTTCHPRRSSPLLPQSLGDNFHSHQRHALRVPQVCFQGHPQQLCFGASFG
jgi:hypothetical protein